MSNENVLTSDQLEEMNAEALLELDLDSIAELEDFKVFPKGLVNFELKELDIKSIGADDKKAIVVKVQVDGYEEYADENDANDVGELPRCYNETFFLEGGKGMGVRAFKTMFGELAKEQGWNTVTDIITGAVGMKGSGLLTINKWTDKATDEKREANRMDAKTIVFE